jgi:hypothetical protein
MKPGAWVTRIGGRANKGTGGRSGHPVCRVASRMAWLTPAHQAKRNRGSVSRAVFSLLLLLHVSEACQAAEDPRSAFLRDYKPDPGFAQALDRGFAFKSRQTDFAGNKTLVSDSEGVFFNGGFSIRQLTARHGQGAPPKTGSLAVELGSAAYDSMLDTTGDGVYAVKQLNLRRGGRRPIPCFLSGPITELHRNQLFTDSVSDPEVSVESYGDAVWRDSRTKALRLAFKWEFGDGIPIQSRNDYYFLPQAGWLCVGFRDRSQAKLDDAVYEEVAYTFSDDRGRWSFVPQSVEYTDVDEHKDSRRRTRLTDVTEVTPRKVEEVEVRLTHFGLPEPLAVTRHRRPWIWLLVAGCVMAALALGLHYTRVWLAQRRAAGGQVTPPAPGGAE